MAIMFSGFLLLTGCTVDASYVKPVEKQQLMSESVYSEKDEEFIVKTMNHYEQMIDMSEAAVGRSSDARVVEFAAKASAVRDVELAKLADWFNSTDGLTPVDDDASMMTDDAMLLLGSIGGDNFDILYLNGMISHYETNIKNAKHVSSSDNRHLANFAKKVIEVQQQEKDRAENILNSILFK